MKCADLRQREKSGELSSLGTYCLRNLGSHDRSAHTNQTASAEGHSQVEVISLNGFTTCSESWRGDTNNTGHGFRKLWYLFGSLLPLSYWTSQIGQLGYLVEGRDQRSHKKRSFNQTGGRNTRGWGQEGGEWLRGRWLRSDCQGQLVLGVPALVELV